VDKLLYNTASVFLFFLHNSWSMVCWTIIMMSILSKTFSDCLGRWIVVNCLPTSQSHKQLLPQFRNMRCFFFSIIHACAEVNAYRTKNYINYCIKEVNNKPAIALGGLRRALRQSPCLEIRDSVKLPQVSSMRWS
jgi:hypothetical protein